MKINCIAIDDEHPALLKMENYISKVPFLNFLAGFNNAIEPIDFLKKNNVDLIFLDIEMDEFTGIQFLKTLKVKPKVILTTAYDSYAIEAFQLDVIDYLLKPISFSRFMQSVEKVYNNLYENKTSTIVSDEPHYKEEYIFVKTDYKTQRVDFKDILYIEGMKEYLCIYTDSGRIITLLSFKKMIDSLPEGKFIRVHRSYIIAFNKIESIEKNRIKIGDKLIPVGETFKKEFYKELEKHKI